MNTEKENLLEAAREKQAALYSQLDLLTEEWAKGDYELYIAELEERLRTAGEEKRDTEEVEDIKAQLALVRDRLASHPSVVRENGEVVTDIPWQNWETVRNVYVWSLCTKSWVFMRTSRYEFGRVCGSIGSGAIHIAKCYGGDFQLMRYEGRLYWIRKGPRTYIRKGGAGGAILAVLAEDIYVRFGTGGYILTSIFDNHIRKGPGGYIVATLDGKLIRKGGTWGKVIAAIDGNFIRSGGPSGVIKYTIDGDATDIQKAALVAGALRREEEENQ